MCKHLCAAIDTLDDRKQWLFSCMVMSFIPPCQINYFLLIRLVVGQVCRPLQASAVYDFINRLASADPPFC